MKNTIILTIAAAVNTVYAEDLLDVLNAIDANIETRDELLAEEEIAKLSCKERINSVDQMSWFCYWKSEFYQGQDRDTKLNQTWETLVPDEDDKWGQPSDIWWDKVPDFFTQKSNGSFCQAQDATGEGRPKIIHTQGLVAKVSWVPVADNGYSGIYETGSDHVLMRLSEAQNLTELSKGLTPSAGFKFYIDGTESQNILVQNSFLESDSWNFFEKPLANRVAPFDPETNPIEFQTVHKKLLEANGRPYGLAISHLSDKYLNGETIDDEALRNFPYELRFRSPNKEAFDYEDGEDEFENLFWHDRLRVGLKAGDTVYEVFALTAPETLGGVEVKIADVKLQTDLYTSELGDQHLYFRHRPLHLDVRQFKERSWKQHENKTNRFERNEDTVWQDEDFPEDVWPEDNDDAEWFFIEQVEAFGCPFAWLVGMIHE